MTFCFQKNSVTLHIQLYSNDVWIIYLCGQNSWSFPQLNIYILSPCCSQQNCETFVWSILVDNGSFWCSLPLLHFSFGRLSNVDAKCSVIVSVKKVFGWLMDIFWYSSLFQKVVSSFSFGRLLNIDAKCIIFPIRLSLYSAMVSGKHMFDRLMYVDKISEIFCT